MTSPSDFKEGVPCQKEGILHYIYSMKRNLLLFASLSGAVCVALGAMGAHFLKEKVSPESLQAYETAVRYQFFHTFAIIAVALLSEKISSKFLSLAGKLFIAGIILFSGSLYFLSLKSLMGVDETQMRWVGAITPFGGISFIAGWLMIFISVFKQKA